MSERLLPDPDALYQALVTKDPEFDGLFFTGVTTTGIFCRPVCTAKKPKRENVEFFSTARDAILAGYRPCRVCRPVEPPVESVTSEAAAEASPAFRFTRESRSAAAAITSETESARAFGVNL